MVSMKDIAKACGVSVATVSKALSGQPDIGEQTRELICKTADSLGYMTNSAARALKTNRTYNIGVLFVDERRSGLAHEYFSSVLESLKVEAEAGGYDIINCFRHSDPEPFYAELENQIAQMRQQGAEAIVLYIHWGQEYKLQPNASQQAMAQRICDLGVDVIIGGHPHVVEPIELLESTVDPNHRTVCLYSMGNAVSNQRLGLLKSISTAHTWAEVR